MGEIMFDASGTAAEMVGHVRAHDGPAQTWTVAQRSVDIAHARHSLLHEVDRFPIEGRRQSVRDVPRHLAPQHDRPPPKRLIELCRMPYDFVVLPNELHKGDQMRRIEGMRND